MADQVDIDHWRIILKALGEAFRDRKLDVSDDELAYVTRFFLEHLEKRSLMVAPTNPSKRMLEASMNALSSTNRPTVRRMGTKRKHRWRIKAALEAVPKWVAGAEEDGVINRPIKVDSQHDKQDVGF